MTKAMEMQEKLHFLVKKYNHNLTALGHGLHVNKDNFPPGVNTNPIVKIKQSFKDYEGSYL